MANSKFNVELTDWDSAWQEYVEKRYPLETHEQMMKRYADGSDGSSFGNAYPDL